MRNDKIEKRKEEHKEAGVSTFRILLLATIAMLIIGSIVNFIVVRIFVASSGSLDSLPLILGGIEMLLIAILMVFFYFNLRCLKTLQEAAEAAERGESMPDSEAVSEGDISDLISVVGRVSSRMSINKDKAIKLSDDCKAFVPHSILEYCHVDIHKRITPGVIGTVKGTRVIIVLGNYKAGTDPRQFANLIDRIAGRGGKMLSSTSEVLFAFFPGVKEEDVRFIEAELKESQILNARYGTYDIVLAGSANSMYVRAREHAG